ncbi:helix-turn-helix domain-containing protein [Helicobacter sp. 11S03491-1]|uniref:IclR family transcriptional regulator n=1 Tax=Helicobacter sp. 11S03491-1 TaxID=1476196 RepID=UPI000BA61683|nr:helix-turn-helix domain-containing protein [Helicobacter sp. 11S03491-1]PAF42288.1 hypothetical protein BKH45_04925 [Helicobacter sp. 11S03491-1]
MENKQKYAAPALSKGLKILEFMSMIKEPISLQALADGLQIKTSQIYRMVYVLELNGYLQKLSQTDRYMMTPKVFVLGNQFRSNFTLIELVMPILNEISQEVNQSCHLAIQTDTNTSVIAQAQWSSPLGFYTKIGFTKPIHTTNSGILILSYLDASLRDKILKFHNAYSEAMIKKLKQIAHKRYSILRSAYVGGVIDLSVPVFSSATNKILGAITVPYINILDNEYTLKSTLKYLLHNPKTKSLYL